MPDTRSHDLLIGTHNRGKFREVCEILASTPFHFRSLNDYTFINEVEETGTTFAENAIIKAKAYSQATELWTLSDDSGLEVDALGGAPGVHSARYAGRDATDAERINLLLEKLATTGDEERRARFVCVIAIADRNANIVSLSTGKCEGRIGFTPKGHHGFGYDPVFIPDGYTQSFGELSSEIKQKISHRARALKQARAFLQSLFESGKLS